MAKISLYLFELPFTYIDIFMKTSHPLSFLEESTETMRAIAHPIRIAIIDLLHRKGKMSVTEIYVKQPAGRRAANLDGVRQFAQGMGEALRRIDQRHAVPLLDAENPR